MADTDNGRSPPRARPKPPARVGPIWYAGVVSKVTRRVTRQVRLISKLGGVHVCPSGGEATPTARNGPSPGHFGLQCCRRQFPGAHPRHRFASGTESGPIHAIIGTTKGPALWSASMPASRRVGPPWHRSARTARARRQRIWRRREGGGDGRRGPSRQGHPCEGAGILLSKDS